MTDANSAPCLLCGASGRPAFVKDGYAHLRCTACGSLFVDPLPTERELEAWYRTSGADKNSALCWEGTGRHTIAAWRRVLRDARRLAYLGPLLDVGCGAGQFLAFAREEGWQELLGVEPFADAAERARAASGATVHEADVMLAPLREGSCAVVTLWDVLEHVPNPRAVLGRVAALLRPGGVAVVSTPNVHGLTTRRFGAQSLVVMPPEHLFVAAQRGLRAAIMAVGLDTVWATSIDIRIRDWVGQSVDGGPKTPDATQRARYRRVYDRITGARAFAAAQRTANLLLSATGMGDQLLTLVRKPRGAS